MDDDAVLRDSLEKDPEVRVPLELPRAPGCTAGALRVYMAIRARAGFDRERDNFMVAFPAVSTIASDAGDGPPDARRALHRTTVLRAIAWLDAADFIFHEVRPNRVSRYFIIVHRTWFRAVAEREGRAMAIARYHEWRQKACSGARPARSAAAVERIAAPTALSGRKSHQRDSRPRHGEHGSHPREASVAPVQPSVAAMRPLDVAAVRPGTVDQDLGSKEHGGERSVAPPPTPGSASKSNSNGLSAGGVERILPLARHAIRGPLPPMTEDQRHARWLELQAMCKAMREEA